MNLLLKSLSSKFIAVLFILLRFIYIYIYIYIYIPPCDIYIHSCHSLCIATFFMFIYFLQTFKSFNILFRQMLLVSLRQSLIQKNFIVQIPLLSHFGLFWLLILVEFFYLLTAVKPFLTKVCKGFLFVLL